MDGGACSARAPAQVYFRFGDKSAGEVNHLLQTSTVSQPKRRLMRCCFWRHKERRCRERLADAVCPQHNVQSGIRPATSRNIAGVSSRSVKKPGDLALVGQVNSITHDAGRRLALPTRYGRASS